MNWRRKSKSDWGRLDLNFKNLSEVSDYVNERVKVENLTVENYISTENMLPNKGGIDKATKLPAAKTTSLYSKGDILLSNIRTYFKKIWYTEKDGGCSNDVLVVRARGEIEPKFLYYVLSNDKFFEYSSATSKGTKMPRGDKSAIMQYQIPDMPLEEQRTIVSVLSALDDRIAENKKINHHLAEILQVNLVQQLNEIPEKHRIGDLELTVSDHVANGSFKSLKENVELVEKPDYALFLRNVDLKNKLNGDRRYVTESSYKFLKKSRLYGHEVIISNVADVGSVHRVPKMNIPMVAGNNVVFLQADNGSLTDYLYVYFNSRLGQHNIESITSGSAQQKFNKTDFRNLEIPILNDEIIHNQITPLLRYMDNINGEISRLIELRDSLLPKLMSGEISVSQAAK
ncbi:restriction endonuclease subunit S [Listeria monocytogenes]|nr:restriction endonuclease subunit S [Listeria monocytogenes]EAD2769450.1 restriction endonuclease subunit S [Listeria monocytogenes]EAF0560395.1 restriction endonuclease subunit S [Listeria monocytogenes]EAF2249983.1 restriction endonuclease subunit S [Listeria monocytogenes]EAF6365848.1 restriction endonuclease subunit S [Listeria monocytogenes]